MAIKSLTNQASGKTTVSIRPIISDITTDSEMIAEVLSKKIEVRSMKQIVMHTMAKIMTIQNVIYRLSQMQV